MDNSNFWWQAAGVDPGPGPGPDPGDPIGQSLRFRGSSSLSGHTGGSGTASVWIKRGKLSAAQTVMPGIAFDASDKLNGSTAVFRDPGAWMHVVVNANGTYVNGASVGSGSAISAGTIGASCELYLADVFFIDGQALEPTAFGRFNSQGVWVPVDPQGLTYGSNGFKLTFEDPSDLGKDYSGNGNNFTATGFNTNTYGPGAELFKEPFRNFQAAVDTTTNPLGDVPTAVPEITTTEQLLFELDTPTTSVDIVWNNGTSSASGVSLFVSPNGTANSFVQILNNVIIGGTISVTNANAFRFIRIGAATPFSWGTGVQQPSGNLDPDFDHMVDTPTSNYATWNPLIPYPSTTFHDANLGVASQSGSATLKVVPTITLGSNTYWETTAISSTNPSDPGIGVLLSTDANAENFSGANTCRVRPEGSAQNGGTNIPSAFVTYDAGDVIGCAFNATTREITFTKNGGNDLTLTVAFEGDLIPLITASINITVNVNFGQQPFTHTPPAGFEALQTQNMPAEDLPDEITGTFTGNNNADGPFVYTGCIPGRIQYGSVDVTYDQRLGQTDVDFLSNGFKVRSTNSNSGTVNYTVTTTHTGGEYDGKKIPFNLPAPATSN